MKKALLFLLILGLSVFIGLTLFYKSGFLLIAVEQWTVQTPLWFAVVALLILFLLFYIILRLLHHVIAMTGYIQQWRIQYRAYRSQRQTQKGFLDLAEGKWRTAEHYLAKAADKAETPFINYLASARAAQAQGAIERRNDYLQKAQASIPHSAVALSLTQAEFQIANEEYAQAKALLLPLHNRYPKHHYLIQLLLRVAIKLADWSLVRELFTPACRYQLLTVEQQSHIRQQMHVGLLTQANALGIKPLQDAWASFAKEAKRDHAIIACYIEYLLAYEQYDVAEGILRQAINREWDEALILLYGLCHSTQPQKCLALAEKWLQSRENDAVLLFTLGRLCIQNALWGKARTYLENSLALRVEIDTYIELAQLLEQLGEHEQAMNYYRKGLLFAAKSASPDKEASKS